MGTSLSSESLNSESLNSKSLNSESLNSESLNSESLNSASVASASLVVGTVGLTGSAASGASVIKASTSHNKFSGDGTADIKFGDVIFRPLPGVSRFVNYCHYGVCVGKKEVIHFTKAGEKGLLKKVSFEVFKDGKQVGIQTDFSSYERRSKKDTAMKAFEIYQLGEGGEDWTKYDLMSNNCEHFANFCATGVKYSRQTMSKK